jgi:hypothetical protein
MTEERVRLHRIGVVAQGESTEPEKGHVPRVEKQQNGDRNNRNVEQWEEAHSEYFAGKLSL